MTNKKYEDIEMEFWSPENPEDSVSGFYISKQENFGENKSNLYNIETSEGVKSVWGSTVLDNKMKLVKIGDDIRIIYLGKVKPEKGREYKDFKIQKATIENPKPAEWF